MHANGFGQIAVRILVLGHPFANFGQQIERIPIVGLLQGGGHFGELQDQEFAPWLQDSAHLLQRRVLVGHVAKPKRHAHSVKAVVGKGQRLGVTHECGQQQALVDQAISPRS